MDVSLKAVRVLICLSAAAFVALACGEEDDAEPQGAPEREPAESQSFVVRVGEANEEAPEIGLFAFYPNSIKVHPGDEIVFENLSDGIIVPHTVTLGAPDQIGQSLPPPVGPDGQLPVVWLTCVSEEGITPETADCPDASAEKGWPPPQLERDTIELPQFSNQTLYNTGIFDPGQTVRVGISSDLEPGTYSFFCYLHPATMTLTVEVVPPDAPTQSQADLDAVAHEAAETDYQAGLDAAAEAEAGDRQPSLVQAGAENGNAVVMAFFPKETTVTAGTTVRWVNPGFDPHVVSMEQGVHPLARENFLPPSLEPGSPYSGGFEISGAISQLFPAQEYALEFVRPGTYDYVCPIHPGMGGSIEVQG